MSLRRPKLKNSRLPLLPGRSGLSLVESHTCSLRSQAADSVTQPSGSRRSSGRSCTRQSPTPPRHMQRHRGLHRYTSARVDSPRLPPACQRHCVQSTPPLLLLLQSDPAGWNEAWQTQDPAVSPNFDPRHHVSVARNPHDGTTQHSTPAVHKGNSPAAGRERRRVVGYLPRRTQHTVCMRSVGPGGSRKSRGSSQRP